MNRIKLTESQLHAVIKESIKRLVKEEIDALSYNKVSRYLENIGFINISDNDDLTYYFKRPDEPITFEKKIWDNDGQIIVDANLYPMGDNTTGIYSVAITFGHGDYSMDEEEGNSGDLFYMSDIKKYIRNNDLERWD